MIDASKSKSIFQIFMLKSVFIYLVSTSINEARNASHRFVPWGPQLDEAWGGGVRVERPKGKRREIQASL